MNKVRLVTYNVDGLPDKLNLKDLPWILKPLAWGYKLYSGTNEVVINDGTDRKAQSEEISKYLKSFNADIIAVQEDFNYHTELMSALEGYKDTTHTGDISLDHLFSKTEWRPLPRFKADGLNVFTNIGTTIRAGEDIVRWKKSNGYIGNANDKLTHKGFRYYEITAKNIPMDVYVVHMDADFYHPGDKAPEKDAEARKSQIKQLLSYIENKPSKNPIIILGDTNTTDKWYWDVNNVKLLHDAGFAEAEQTKEKDVDRLFYKNNDKSLYEITGYTASYGKGGLSDHKPLIVDLHIERRKRK